MMKQIPDALKNDIIETLDSGGREIVSAQRASARRKTGAMAAGLRSRLLRKSMTLKVGFVGKATNRRLFYAKILGGGRKAQTVTAKRGGSSYALRVAARAPEPVIDPPAAKAARSKLVKKLEATWRRVLETVARGGGGND